jgi:hypothetical protein
MNDPAYRFPWRWIAGMALLVTLALTVIAFRGPSGVAVGTARAARKDLIVPILSDGTLEPAAGGELRAPEAATVAAIPAREGERREGSAARHSPEPRADAGGPAGALDRRAAVRGADPRGRRSRAAEAETARTKETFDADGRLVKEYAIPRAVFETDELAYRQAMEKLRVAQARFDSLAGSGAGRSSLELSETAARELERRVAALTLSAPSAGIAYGLPRKTGETVAACQVVANVADPITCACAPGGTSRIFPASRAASA